MLSCPCHLEVLLPIPIWVSCPGVNLVRAGGDEGLEIVRLQGDRLLGSADISGRIEMVQRVPVVLASEREIEQCGLVGTVGTEKRRSPRGLKEKLETDWR